MISRPHLALIVPLLCGMACATTRTPTARAPAPPPPAVTVVTPEPSMYDLRELPPGPSIAFEHEVDVRLAPAPTCGRLHPCGLLLPWARPTADGGVILAGDVYGGVEWDGVRLASNRGTWRNPIVMRLDSAGVLRWHDVATATPTAAYEGAFEVPEGELILWGRWFTDSDYDMPNQELRIEREPPLRIADHYVTYVARLSPDEPAVRWRTDLISEGLTYIVPGAVRTTSDGSVIALATFADPDGEATGEPGLRVRSIDGAERTVVTTPEVSFFIHLDGATGALTEVHELPRGMRIRDAELTSRGAWLVTERMEDGRWINDLVHVGPDGAPTTPARRIASDEGRLLQSRWIESDALHARADGGVIVVARHPHPELEHEHLAEVTMVDPDGAVVGSWTLFAGPDGESLELLGEHGGRPLIASRPRSEPREGGEPNDLTRFAVVTLVSLESDGPRAIATLPRTQTYEVLQVEEDGRITYVTKDPSRYLRAQLPK